MSVQLTNTLDTLNAWVLRISIKRETMINTVLAHEMRLTTEAKGWEVPITVIWFQDIPNLHYGCIILVVHAQKVQAAWICRFTI